MQAANEWDHWAVSAAVELLGEDLAERVQALMQALIDACTARGYRQMVAVIGDSANTGSIALHEAAGFAHVGAFRDAGWKFDGWRDVVFMQKALGAGGAAPPDADGLDCGR